MINFSITIAKDSSAQLEQLICNIPVDEWQTIVTFHTEVKRLRSTRFVQNKRGGQISFKFEQGKSATTKPQNIDEDEVGAMLLKLRPFILQKEKLYFHKVKNLLKRNLIHKSFRKFISDVDKKFTLDIMSKKISVRVNSHQILAVDFVMDWLNSFEYHRDQKKKNSVENTLDFFGQIQNGQPVILFALTDMIQAILDLGKLAQMIIEFENGTRSEIKFSSKYFE